MIDNGWHNINLVCWGFLFVQCKEKVKYANGKSVRKQTQVNDRLRQTLSLVLPVLF